MEKTNKQSQILVVLGTLIEAAGDKNEPVREAVSLSLKKLARKHPNAVLSNVVAYRSRNLKMPPVHLAVLLETAEKICEENLQEINNSNLTCLIEFAVEEMTRNPDYSPDSQMPASGILVALGQKYCNEVMDGILKPFQPGIIPHYSILHTMGKLASANAFGIVPFIKATLGTMLPMMGMVRNDAMKQAFSFVLGRFSEAIMDYMENIDKAPDPTVKNDAFSSEISSAYDILVSVWIHSRDQKVCETVLQAVGPMFAILPSDKLNEQLLKMIPTMLNMYRRNIDPYPITQCLATILLVAINHNKNCLESHLDTLMTSIFDLVCSSPDYAQPSTVKNHYEVLRCFDRIAGYSCDRVVDFLIQQLKNGEREKVKSLLVITHLANSADNVFRPRIPELTTSLLCMMSEQNVKIKMALLKAIVAFAYKDYLERSAAKQCIEFIVKNCCPPASSNVNKNVDQNNLTEELNLVCASTLYLLTTTVPQVERSLWLFLLQAFLIDEYTLACTALIRCLSHLSCKRKEDQDLANGTHSKANEESCPFSIFVRCLALLGNPQECKRGVYVLTFLKNYSEYVNRHLKPLWEQKIPELVTYLEETGNKWQEYIWEDLILEFLSSTLSEVDEETWTIHLGEKLVKQLPLYNSYPLERGILLKSLAIILCHTRNRQFVNSHLDVILSSIRHNTSVEGKACARSVGICSRRHLDLVLTKLEILRKDELSRKSSRILSFMKDVKHEEETESARLTLLLCYGELSLEAPCVELLPKVENGVAQWVVQQLQTAKDATTTEEALKTLGKIAEGLHPNHNSLHILMQSRMQVLHLVLNQLHATAPDIQKNLIITILKVATAYIKLPPSLTSEERVTILKMCFTKVYNSVLVISSDGSKESTQSTYEIDNILISLGELVQELLLDSVCPSTLDEMFTLLEPWLIQKNAYQRAAALETLNTILHCYINNVKFGYETPTKFSQTGLILGRIIPRCTDPNLNVRRKASDCVYLVLCLAARYEGHSPDYDTEFMAPFTNIQNQLQTENPQQLFKATGELAQIICSKLPQFQVIPFTDSLLDALLDNETSSSSGASVILNMFLKSKGGELYHHVSEILNGILKQLTHIHCVQTRNGSIRAILALATHHPKAVVSALLLQPIPYELSVTECWMILAQDPVLSSDIIDQFLRLISSTPLYELQQDKLKIAVLLPLAAISAMHNMFSIATMQAIALKNFPELFTMFLIAMGCYVGISPPIHTPQKDGNKSKHGFVPNRNAYKLNPAKVAQDAFKAFLLCSNCEAVAEALLQCIHLETGENMISFLDMIPDLAKKLCVYMPQSLTKIVVCMNQYGTSSFEPQRVTVAAFYAELVHLNGNSQTILLESIMTNLLNCQTDPSPLVRQLCLKGLSSISHLKKEEMERHSDVVLTALLQGLDDQENGSQIPFEAMKGLSKMCRVVDGEQIQSIQVTVSLRIKPYFEKEEPSVRAIAFRTFGDISKYGGVPSKNPFLEQVNGNLVSLLLHLNDDDESVIKACKYALKEVCPLLSAEKFCAMCQEHLNEDAYLYYSVFMADLTKYLVDEMSDLVPFLIVNSLSFIKSSSSTMRGNAAMFIGMMCGHLPSDICCKVPLDTVCSRLIQLLKDENQDVRAKVAHSLSSVFIS